MYYIVINKNDTILEYITVHRDKNDDLALVDITTNPYFIEDENECIPLYFEDVMEVVNYLKKAYKVDKVNIIKLNNLPFSENIKMSSMITY